MAHTIGTISISDEEWLRHCYIIGATGSGKSNQLDLLMKEDLANGEGFCFIDWHGSEARRLADHADRPLIYVRPAQSKEHIVGISPMVNRSLDDRWAVDAICSGFADIWDLGEHTPRLMNNLSSALFLLLEDPDATLLGIRRVFTNDEYRARLLKKCKDPVIREIWEGYDQRDWKERLREVDLVLNKADALAKPLPLRYALSFRSLNIKRIMDKRQVLLVDLSGMGSEARRHYAALLISQFRLNVDWRYAAERTLLDGVRPDYDDRHAQTG